MTELLHAFKGYKTYIVVVASVVFTGLLGTGYITEEQFQMFQTILAALGLGFLRAGIKNTIRGEDEIL